MATLNFPPTPINGETYSSGGVTWTYNSTYSVWNITSSGPTGYTGSKGDIGYTGSQGDTGYTGSTGTGFTPLVGGQSWNTDGSLINTNVYWYVPEPPGFGAFAVGNYILLSDQTSGSTYYYYGRITLIQFAGGFGWALHADILGDGGVPIGGSSSSWITELTGQRGQIGYSGSQGAIGYTGSAAAGGGSSFTVGQVIQSAVAPSTGTWLQTGKYYSKASYSALAAVLGDVPDIGTPVTKAEAQIPVTCTFSDSQRARAVYCMATNGTAYVFGQASNGRIIYTTDGVKYSAVPINVNATAVTGVWYVNGRFVATLNTLSTVVALLAVSTDGITWESRSFVKETLGGTAAAATSIAYGAGMYVISYFGGGLIYSTDLVTFNFAPSAPSGSVFNKVIYANGQFVAVGNNIIYTSPDGINWTVRTSPTNINYLDVIYANSLYVAYGTRVTGNLATSTDGVTWTTRSAGSSSITHIAYVGGLFITAGTGSNIYTSPDGLTWTATASGLTGSSSVGYVGTTYYIGGGSGYYSTSADAITWTISRDVGGSTASGIFNVAGKAVAACGAGIIVLAGASRDVYQPAFDLGITIPSATIGVGHRPVAYNGSNQYVMLTSTGLPLYSSDGYNWIGGVLPGGITGGTGNGIAYLNGNYLLLLSNSTSSIITSSDGINWTVRTTPSSGLLVAAYGAGTYVAAGQNGRVYSSTDLATWVSRSAGTNQFNDIIFDNGVFVAVGANGACWSSTDGVTWTQRTAGSNAFTRVTWVGGAVNLFIAIGESGSLYTSPDGATWTLRTSSLGSNGLNDIVYNSTSGLIVVVGQLTGTIATSTDGINWANRSLGETNYYLNSVIWDGTQYTAYVYNTTTAVYFRSTDGITWTRSSFRDISTTAYVQYLGGKYIRTVTSGGGITVSTDGITWRAIDQTSYRMSTTPLDHITKINGVYFVSGWNGTYPTTYTSTDGINFTPTRTAPRGFIAYSGTHYFSAWRGANSSLGIYRSSDGLSWTHYSDLGTSVASSRLFNTNTLTEIIYAGGKLSVYLNSAAVTTVSNISTIYYSTDGLTWTPASTPYGYLNGYAGTDGTTIVGSFTLSGLASSVYKTTDGGATWSAVVSSTATPIIYSGGYWNWTGLKTPDATTVISGSSVAPAALGTYNGYTFNINSTIVNIWKNTLNSTTVPYTKYVTGLPANFGANPNNKETPVRTSDQRALVLGNIQSFSAAVVNPIIEYPLFSYDTATTFFVPQQSTSISANEYIYAGA